MLWHCVTAQQKHGVEASSEGLKAMTQASSMSRRFSSAYLQLLIQLLGICKLLLQSCDFLLQLIYLR